MQNHLSHDVYFGHQLVTDAFMRHISSNPADILDLGCGTGLVGVDLFKEMLEQARAKHLYCELFCEDLATFMFARIRAVRRHHLRCPR